MGLAARVYRTAPDVTVHCRPCPHCGWSTAVFLAGGGRGLALYRCVNPQCGRLHRADYPGALPEGARSRCRTCLRPIPYGGRGRPRKTCDACMGGR